MKEKKNKYVSIPLTESDYNKAIEQATQDNRTLADYLRIIILRGLERWKKIAFINTLQENNHRKIY